MGEGCREGEKQQSKVNVVGGWFEMIIETVLFNRFKLKSIKSELVNISTNIKSIVDDLFRVKISLSPNYIYSTNFPTNLPKNLHFHDLNQCAV